MLHVDFAEVFNKETSSKSRKINNSFYAFMLMRKLDQRYPKNDFYPDIKYNPRIRHLNRP